MKLIVCVEDSFGMLFNKRRLSSDKSVIGDILATVGKDSLYINSYSAPLFSGFEGSYIISENILCGGNDNDYLFAENIDLSEHLGKFNTVILYKWNRRYPSDLKFPVNKLSADFKLFESLEFKGNSHPLITKEVYINEKA